MDKKVEAYFNRQKDKSICLKLRRIIIKTFPGVKEEMRWGVPVYDGGKFYVACVKKGVNLGFSVKGLSDSDVKNFRGKGKLMRHLKFESLEEIDEKEIVKLLKLVSKKSLNCE